MTDGGQRIDKWLFFARIVKSRSLAQKLIASGAVRINRDKTDNAARTVRPGDVLTVSLHGAVRVLKILDPGTRRGPASEAATLFEDLSPRQHPDNKPEASPSTGDGFVPSEKAPSKRDRRELGRLKRGEID